MAGAKLISLGSTATMAIPLESLEQMLSLCEDALVPLEGLQARLAAAEAEARRATSELEQEKQRSQRLEARLRGASEALTSHMARHSVKWVARKALAKHTTGSHHTWHILATRFLM